MELSRTNYVKILFRFYSNVLEKETVETIWATVVNKERGYYKIENTPFYANSIALGDIVFAEQDETEKATTYRSTIKYSGNSTVQVVLLDKSTNTDYIRSAFDSLGCSSEKFKERYFVIDVPAEIDYSIVLQNLIEFRNKGLIDFAESSLSDKHRI